MNKAVVPSRYFARDFRSGRYSFVLQRLIGVPVDRNLEVRFDCYFWQIYSVQIETDDENDLQKIYGKIKVQDSVIFERCVGDPSPHFINEEGFVRLTGPMHPLDGDLTNIIEISLFMDRHPVVPNQSVSFSSKWYPRSSFDAPGLEDYLSRSLNLNRNSVSLWNSDSNQYARLPIHPSHLKDCVPSSSSLKFKKDEPCLMEMFDREMYTPRGVIPGPSNEILSKMIDIEGCCRVKVIYAALDDSADCFLTIKLLKFKGAPYANVFGHVRTSNGLFEGDDRAKSLIYDRKRDEKQRVKPGQYIELLRPVNVLPMGDTLNVEVNILHEYVNSKTVSAIASGTCSFRAKCTYNNRISWRRHDHEIVDSRNISGPLGTIQVKAYWLPYWCFSYYNEYNNAYK